MKNEEIKTVTKEVDAKKSEMTRLGNVKNVIQSRQDEYDYAKRNHDEFMMNFKVKSEELKRELRVSL
jgi:hypothetical protein